VLATHYLRTFLIQSSPPALHCTLIDYFFAQYSAGAFSDILQDAPQQSIR